MAIVVDACELARGWLSVAAATSTLAEDRKERPQLYKTVQVERHPHGLRLAATDGFIFLTTWVPERDHELDEPAGLDEVPIATAIAVDEHGRGLGLCGHFLKLVKPDSDGNLLPKLDVYVSLNVPIDPHDEEAGGTLQLEGLEALAVTIEQPDHERLQLPVWEGAYPAWKRIIASHEPKATRNVALMQAVAARLAKAAKPHGPTTRIRCSLAGKSYAIAVAFGEVPEVTGLVMPARWDWDRDEPVATGVDE